MCVPENFLVSQTNGLFKSIQVYHMFKISILNAVNFLQLGDKN